MFWYCVSLFHILSIPSAQQLKYTSIDFCSGNKVTVNKNLAQIVPNRHQKTYRISCMVINEREDSHRCADYEGAADPINHSPAQRLRMGIFVFVLG